MDSYRVWADVDLGALEANLSAIRARAGAGVELWLVVKADAYGHGAVATAHHAVRFGVEALGVGTSAEALELRRAGICVPILVLGTVVDEEVVGALTHDVQIGLHSTDRCHMLQRVAARMQRVARVHLNVDTGMGRLGVLPDRSRHLLETIHAASHLELAGIMTHFATSGGSPEADRQRDEQVQRFESVLAEARELGPVGTVHAASSGAVFSGATPLYDAVRIGLGAYGIAPGSSGEDLYPVLSLRTQIIFLKDVPAGATVGYDSTWRATRRSRVATLPIGYNDGVAWRTGNRGSVLVRGRRAPIVGRVSMDYTTIDVTDIPCVDVGDRVTLIGTDGEQTIRAEDMAAWADTIPHEITCSVGKRVERVFRSTEHAMDRPGQRLVAGGELPQATIVPRVAETRRIQPKGREDGVRPR